MKQTATNLGAMLKRYRVNESLGLRELAQRVGVSAPTLMRVEHGFGMDADTFMALLTWMLKPNGNGKEKR
jgi:transcriptional regulator with XRE-family HTH domain